MKLILVGLSLIVSSSLFAGQIGKNSFSSAGIVDPTTGNAIISTMIDDEESFDTYICRDLSVVTAQMASDILKNNIDKCKKINKTPITRESIYKSMKKVFSGLRDTYIHLSTKEGILDAQKQIQQQREFKTFKSKGNYEVYSIEYKGTRLPLKISSELPIKGGSGSFSVNGRLVDLSKTMLSDAEQIEMAIERIELVVDANGIINRIKDNSIEQAPVTELEIEEFKNLYIQE